MSKIKSTESVQPEPPGGRPEIVQHAGPIGTIVASLLNCPTFLRASGLQHSIDMRVVSWVPCDGRNIAVSRYGGFSGGRVPDLRCVFLRGINDYQVPFPGVDGVPSSQANPENTKAGIFQSDAIQKHTHKQIWGQNSGSPSSPAQGNDLSNYKAEKMTQSTAENPNGKEETRPKNITVYYYTKVN